MTHKVTLLRTTPLIMTSISVTTKALEMRSSDNLEMLNRWRTNCRRSQIANYTSANRFANRNYFLGVPTVVLSAMVATTVFAALGQSVELHIQILVGFVSVVAAVLAALQTFLRFDELASKHRSIAAEYGSVKRQLDQEIAKLGMGGEVWQQTVDSIRERMDTLSRDGPVVPQDIWTTARVVAPTAADKPSE
ncbi:MAG: SLATT domain-containing protein [Deltaproteobacteria bacterium]|nr:SLATT domain-containing protein [Deltaproteobacteria bacterium]